MTKPLSQEEIVRQGLKYETALVAYAYGLLQDWASAQDAVQNAYVVAMKKREDFDPESNIFTWLRSIVRFEALNMIRDRRREAAANEQLRTMIDEKLQAYWDEDEALRTRRAAAALDECMMRLKRKWRELILSFYRDAVSCEKLAVAHSMTPNAVRLTLSRSRKSLRKCVSARMSHMERSET
jgi:RNA polymerase sigma-70 factor (ECF subfamily)